MAPQAVTKSDNLVLSQVLVRSRRARTNSVEAESNISFNYEPSTQMYDLFGHGVILKVNVVYWTLEDVST